MHTSEVLCSTSGMHAVDDIHELLLLPAPTMSSCVSACAIARAAISVFVALWKPILPALYYNGESPAVARHTDK
jgi:hypothetical protein